MSKITMEEDEDDDEDLAVCGVRALEDIGFEARKSVVAPEDGKDGFQEMLRRWKAREEKLEAFENLVCVETKAYTGMFFSEDEVRDDGDGESQVLKKAKALLTTCERRSKFYGSSVDAVQKDDYCDEAGEGSCKETLVNIARKRVKLMEESKSNALARRIDMESRSERTGESMAKHVALIEQEQRTMQTQVTLDQEKDMEAIEKQGETALKLIDDEREKERKYLLENAYLLDDGGSDEWQTTDHETISEGETKVYSNVTEAQDDEHVSRSSEDVAACSGQCAENTAAVRPTHEDLGSLLRYCIRNVDKFGHNSGVSVYPARIQKVLLNMHKVLVIQVNSGYDFGTKFFHKVLQKQETGNRLPNTQKRISRLLGKVLKLSMDTAESRHSLKDEWWELEKEAMKIGLQLALVHQLGRLGKSESKIVAALQINADLHLEDERPMETSEGFQAVEERCVVQEQPDSTSSSDSEAPEQSETSVQEGQGPSSFENKAPVQEEAPVHRPMQEKQLPQETSPFENEAPVQEEKPASSPKYDAPVQEQQETSRCEVQETASSLVNEATIREQQTLVNTSSLENEAFIRAYELIADETEKVGSDSDIGDDDSDIGHDEVNLRDDFGTEDNRDDIELDDAQVNIRAEDGHTDVKFDENMKGAPTQEATKDEELVSLQVSNAGFSPVNESEATKMAGNFLLVRELSNSQAFEQMEKEPERTEAENVSAEVIMKDAQNTDEECAENVSAEVVQKSEGSENDAPAELVRDVEQECAENAAPAELVRDVEQECAENAAPAELVRDVKQECAENAAPAELVRDVEQECAENASAEELYFEDDFEDDSYEDDFDQDLETAEEVQSITKIQALVRGRICRAKYERLKAERKKMLAFLPKMQARWRGSRARKLLKAERKAQNVMATKIQSKWRGSAMRTKFRRALAKAKYIDDDELDYSAIDSILFTVEETVIYDQAMQFEASLIAFQQERSSSTRHSSVSSLWQSREEHVEAPSPTEPESISNSLSFGTEPVTTTSEEVPAWEAPVDVPEKTEAEKRKEQISLVAKDWGFKNEKTVMQFLKACSKKRASKDDGSNASGPTTDARKRRGLSKK